MNNSQSFTPLEPANNLLINRRAIKLTSAIDRLKDLPSYRSKGAIQNAFHNFRSNNSNSVKVEVNKEKQNFGMHVEAYKMGLNKNPENILFGEMENSKPLEFHSKSFKIRLNYRKSSSKKLQIQKNKKFERQQASPKKEKFKHYLQTTTYTPDALKGITEEISCFSRDGSFGGMKNWGIFIPAVFLNQQNLQIKEILQTTFKKGIEIFLKICNDEEYSRLNSFGYFCNLIKTQRNTIAEKEIFVNLKDKYNLPKNLIFVDAHKDYPLWYPYWPNCSEKVIFTKAKDLRFLKFINCENNEDEMTYFNSKPLLQRHQIHDCLHEKIFFLKKTKKSKRNRRNSEEIHPYDRGGLQDFQEKMIKYIKILQKEKEGKLCLNNSKSSYQIISDLIRNNRHIHKQIQGYIGQTQGIKFSGGNRNQKEYNIDYYFLD